MTIQYNNIIFSYLDDRKRQLSTGTRQETTKPNALSDNYDADLNIPELVSTPRGIYKVTEIGRCSFYKAEKLRYIFIPASVTAIRNSAFSGLQNLISFTFAKDSRLKIVEDNAFYDFYKVEELLFPGYCLQTMGSGSLAYSFLIKTLIFPASFKSFDSYALGGLSSITDLYYCSTSIIDNLKVFVSNSSSPQTNADLRIHVPIGYQSTNFGGRQVTDNNVGDYCKNVEFVCDEMLYLMTQTKSQFHKSLFFIFIMIIPS